MNRRILIGACWLGALSSAGFAQVGAPQLGWVPDEGRIRPVYGIPAAAAVGAPLPVDQNFSQIAASPGRNYVLVSAADTGTVSIYTTRHGLVPLDGAGLNPDGIVLSPRGSSAALWFSSLNAVQIVAGLPDAPTIRQFDVSFSGSAPSGLAVSDDGAWVAGAWTAHAYAFGPNGDVNLLPLDGATTLAFLEGSSTLAAAGTSGLHLVTGIQGFAVVSNLLTSADSSLQPVALAATSGNRALVLADRSGSVTVIEIDSGAATASDCGCQPAGLFGMGPSVFRLTSLDGGAFKLFDAARGEILFAPLALAEAEGTAQGAAQ